MLNGLRASYAEALTSFSYLGLLVFGLHLNEEKYWSIALALIAAISFFSWASTFKRARAIADIATSRIASAAQGYVEIHGRASVAPENLVRSPLSGVACVWFRYWVYSKENSDREWRLVSSGVSDNTFEITDGTGSCVVDPDYAEVIAAQHRVSYQGNYKHVEDILYAGSIYVLGEFSTIGGANSELSLKEDVSFLLAEWKKDPIKLKKRFDLNEDGEIDLQEWELARHAAIREVEMQHREIRKETGVHIMRAPRDKRLYLLSSLEPQKLRQRYLRRSFFHLFTCFAATATLIKFSF